MSFNTSKLKKQSGQQSGFTLIELMIVLIIVGLVLGAGIPALQTRVANSQADRVADELKLDIAFARTQARVNATETGIYPHTNGWTTGWQVKQGTSVIRERGTTASPMIDSGTLTGDFDTATPISFDRKGRAINTGKLTIKVSGCSGKRNRTLEINQIGQVIESELSCS